MGGAEGEVWVEARRSQRGGAQLSEDRLENAAEPDGLSCAALRCAVLRM